MCRDRGPHGFPAREIVTDLMVTGVSAGTCAPPADVPRLPRDRTRIGAVLLAGPRRRLELCKSLCKFSSWRPTSRSTTAMSSDEAQLKLHGTLMRRAVSLLASGLALGVLTAVYFEHKMGTVTENPQPFVYALYGASVALVLLGANTWRRARVVRAQIVGG